MSDDSGKQRLLSYLADRGPGLWTILPTLAGYHEPNLRAILRPHDDAGISFGRDNDIIQLRSRLDDAFGALTLLEIAYETSVFTLAEQPVPELPSLRLLFKSESVLRYANAYLYFAIRFLAHRIDPDSLLATPPPLEPTLGAATDAIDNQRSFPLIHPPAFVADPRTDANFAEFVDRLTPPGVEDALGFLDGFYIGSDEPQQYELWLRGLRPEWNLKPVPEPNLEWHSEPGSEPGSDSSPQSTLQSNPNPPLAPNSDPNHEINQLWHDRFAAISAGLAAWAAARSEFYLSLQSSDAMPKPAAQVKTPIVAREDARPLGGWIVVNPVAARFALADVYWIARLLRADITAGAIVTYPRTSWMKLLRFQASLHHDEVAELALRKAEEVMRSVFDFVCDLAQNAVGLSVEKQRRFFEPHQYPAPLTRLRQWRGVFDEELEEIMLQRIRRSFRESEVAPGEGGEGRAFIPPCPSDDDWSERLRSGKKPQNLVGLAFSGGGIRSATFNLGVLQGLQAFDQLRYVDYLSTVSGGGFIGSWLVGNVKRSQHWLGRLTSWDESIAHLRAYSNYLAPLNGILSADTWGIGAIWARNAFLIQLTGFTWLLALLLGILLARLGFVDAIHASETSSVASMLPQVAAGLMGLLITCTLVYNFTQRIDTGKGALGSHKVKYLAVVPAWIGAFCITLHLWSNAVADGWSQKAQTWTTFSAILQNAWRPWCWLLGTYLAALLVTLTVSLTTSVIAGLRDKPTPKQARALAWRAFGRAVWVGLLCLAVLYLALCAIFSIFLGWHTHIDRFGSYAFVFGPALVLAAFTLSITLLIGLSGRASNEAQREWWTRLGTWVAIYASIGLALSAIAVFSPRLFLIFHTHSSGLVGTIKWGTLATWLGTIFAGLLSGKSSKTSGEGNKSPLLELLAKLAGLLFILGSIFATSTILYLFLLKIGTDGNNLHTDYWIVLQQIHLPVLVLTLVVVAGCSALFAWYFEINIFGLNQFYRNRLVRCYLGATRWALGERSPHPFTKFDFKDDLGLGELAVGFRGPFPILNCTLNLAGSSDLAVKTRHSASFSLTPFRCGSDRPRVGYAPTGTGKAGFADGIKLGQAVAISGAAASPNMGYNTSPLVAFLLTMFNVRLGWWFPNPAQKAWGERGMRFSFYYLLHELFGTADEKRLFLNVSDGGHFENLGIYELVRRRCKVIIACDAECDELYQFGGLGNVIRICETDFGATIDIDVKSIRRQKEGDSLAHCTVGKITYANGSIGYLLYIKASITGDEDVSVAQYRSSHPTFPHETTSDQFFSEDQFESYRKLGQHIVRHALRGNQPGDHPVVVAERLADVLAPAGFQPETFLKHSRALDEIWERFRQSPNMGSFLNELVGMPPPLPSSPARDPEQEFCFALELLQLMENVFMDLRMDDFWEHPDNRGWAMLFMGWARSPRFRQVWAHTNRTFGIRFEYFCDARLGLTRDNPIVRV